MLARPSFRLQRSCSTASMTLVPYFSLFTQREQDAILNKSPQKSAYFNSPKNLPGSPLTSSRTIGNTCCRNENSFNARGCQETRHQCRDSQSLQARKKVPAPKTVRLGNLKVHAWSEKDIEAVRKLLPKIENGRHTRYKKQRKKSTK
jgi:hypothetical protein